MSRRGDRLVRDRRSGGPRQRVLNPVAQEMSEVAAAARERAMEIGDAFCRERGILAISEEHAALLTEFYREDIEQFAAEYDERKAQEKAREDELAARAAEVRESWSSRSADTPDALMFS